MPAAALQIIGEDSNFPSGSTTARDRSSDNLFYDVDSDRWGGTGAFVLIGEAPSDITDRAQHRQPERQHHHGLRRHEGRSEADRGGFVFRDNLIRHNEYGVHGSDRAHGAGYAAGAFFPAPSFSPT